MTTAQCIRSLEFNQAAAPAADKETRPKNVADIVDAAFEHFATYERKLKRRPEDTPVYSPYEHRLAAGNDPQVFLADVEAVARTYGSKLKLWIWLRLPLLRM